MTIESDGVQPFSDDKHIGIIDIEMSKSSFVSVIILLGNNTTIIVIVKSELLSYLQKMVTNDGYLGIGAIASWLYRM